MRLFLCAASTMANPSSTVCDMGFSQYTSLPAATASSKMWRCWWSMVAMRTESTSLRSRMLAVVAHGFDVGILHRFLGGGVAAVVKIADRDALNAGHIERRLEMFASANAGADGGEADGVAGRNPARGSVELMRLQDVLGDGGSSDRAGTELNESTAGQGILRHEFPSSQLQQVIFRRGEFAAAEMMRRNYCIAEGELVKRFSKEVPQDGLNAGS